jgi:hypothetical protein
MTDSMSKMKFDPHTKKQSRMIEGVSCSIGYGGVVDYDALLREAIRLALRMEAGAPDDGAWNDLQDRIQSLMDAYVASPEGAGEDPAVLLTRLAVNIADVIPETIRKELVTPSSTGMNREQAS